MNYYFRFDLVGIDLTFCIIIIHKKGLNTVDEVVMNKYGPIILGIVLMQGSFISSATNCPDPETTSLKWGVPPPPWVENPFSPNHPQGEDNTRFVRANILVAGYGQGVMCTYHYSRGEYSIWWQVLTKIPAPSDYRWIDTLGGFVCTQGRSLCQFDVAGTALSSA